MTATRSITIPTGTPGDIIEISISNGDDAYELIVKGASTVTINGGSAATEWSRLFITNEFVQLVCVSSTAWIVTVDGRIPCQAYAQSYGIEWPSISSIDATNNTVTLSSAPSGVAAGDPIYCRGGYPWIAGMPGTSTQTSSNTVYVGTLTNSNKTFKLYSTYSNAVAGTSPIDITSATIPTTTIYKTLIFPNGHLLQLRCDISNVNAGNTIDSTNHRIKIRRTGTYTMQMSSQYADYIQAGLEHQAFLTAAGPSGSPPTDAQLMKPIYAIANLYGYGRAASAVAGFASLAAGDFVYASCRHYASPTQGQQHSVYDPFLTVLEQL